MTTEALSMVHNISSLTTTQQTQLHIPPEIPLLNILAKNEKRIKTHRIATQQQQGEEGNSSCQRGWSPNGLTGSQDFLLVTSYQLPRCSALRSRISCVRLCINTRMSVLISFGDVILNERAHQGLHGATTVRQAASVPFHFVLILVLFFLHGFGNVIL
ncbi:GM18560 [Drosophila sechellia]|uniref:GM18560 n=1 Tax=Drosophila sechellia TaxID=7238 RepID=B4HWS0_DROSE|nr:GM18560 [Drosophila sechellia]